MRVLSLLLCAAASISAQSLVIRNVTVIDGTGAPSRKGMTVVVNGSTITQVGVGLRPPPKAHVVDGTGKYLIPGLWDMHVRLPEGNPMLESYVAHGVTGIRDMGSNFAVTKQWRSEIATGKVTGPRIVTCGSPIGGRSGPEAARRAVNQLDESGVDFIGVESTLGIDEFESVAQRARMRRISFAGTLPEQVSADTAIDLRQRSMEHLSGILLSCTPLETTLRQQYLAALEKGDTQAIGKIKLRVRETFSESQANVLFRKMELFEVAQCPTLHALAEKLTKKDAAEYETFRRLVRMMARSGVLLLAGSNFGEAGVEAGVGLHEELAELVAAGVTPMQALQSATLNPARSLGIQATEGTIAKGKLANLVLLGADPLADIRNSREIAAVVLRGKLRKAGRQ